jgi:hypothetical protein
MVAKAIRNVLRRKPPRSKYRTISEASAPVTDEILIAGTVEVTTPDGISAIVKLDKPVDGFKRAVIGPETKGLIALLNGKGRIEIGTHVEGRAKRGPQAFAFRDVKLAS